VKPAAPLEFITGWLALSARQPDAPRRCRFLKAYRMN